MEPTRVEFAGHNGLKLAADSYGTPGNQPVLLAHGGGQTRHAWGGAAKTLAAQGWHAISVDLRGHGDSEWCPDANYSIDAYAEDLRKIAATFDRKPAAVGASLGGSSSLIAEGEHPENVFAALVLVDITPKVEEEGVQKIRGFMHANMEEGFGSLEEAADAIAKYLPHRPRPKSLEGLKKNLRLRENGRYYWHWDPKFSTGPSRPRDARRPERMENAARSLDIPTLLVRGKMSDLVSEEAAREFMTMVPHAEFVDVSGAGHMVAGDKNDAFAEAVVSFLNRL